MLCDVCIDGVSLESSTSQASKHSSGIQKVKFYVGWQLLQALSKLT